MRRDRGEERKASSWVQARGRRGIGATKDRGGGMKMAQGQDKEERGWLMWELKTRVRVKMRERGRG